jgi:hypothetical protein
MGITVPLRGYDSGVKNSIACQGIPVVDAVPVGLDLGLLSITCRPVWVEFAGE